MGDFFLGIRVEDDEGVFDAPVGGVGDVRDAGQAVESDVVATGVLAQHLEHLAAQVDGFAETCLEAVDGLLRGDDQAADLLRTLGILGLALGTTLLDFLQTMAQGADQRVTALTVVEQVVFQVRVALDHPDVAQHLVEHPRRTAGDALAAQFVEDRPVVGTEQADDDFAVGKRGVVVGDFAQAGGHGSSRDLSKEGF